MIKNINGTKLKPCSLHPVTGYQRKGYCYDSKEDVGKHLVCAKMDKRVLNYTKSKGNDLSSVVREGDNWCLCEDRFYQAYKAGKAPKVIKSATHKNVYKPIRKTIRSMKGGKKTRKQRLRKKIKKYIRSSYLRRIHQIRIYTKQWYTGYNLYNFALVPFKCAQIALDAKNASPIFVVSAGPKCVLNFTTTTRAF